MPRDDDARDLFALLRGRIADLIEAEVLLVRELELGGKLSTRFADDHVSILRGIAGRMRVGGGEADDEAVPSAAMPSGEDGGE